MRIVSSSMSDWAMCGVGVCGLMKFLCNSLLQPCDKDEIPPISEIKLWSKPHQVWKLTTQHLSICGICPASMSIVCVCVGCMIHMTIIPA